MKMTAYLFHSSKCRHKYKSNDAISSHTPEGRKCSEQVSKKLVFSNNYNMLTNFSYVGIMPRQLLQ